MAGEGNKLSESEALLMRILWEEDCDMSMRELMDEAADKYGRIWAKQTVSTLLKRMEEAGYVSMYREGRIFYYHAEVSAKTYRGTEVVDFCKTWFDGDPVAMMEAYMKKKKLTPSQKRRLKDAIS
ncbi:MAG: BlaI/MecI/CopY family transcriptional regulator [Lachnospiraceae bacterium]|nr:BlaI/MecI/CopY family transcriptional regulator [Lachnospiraceae bacterium]